MDLSKNLLISVRSPPKRDSQECFTQFLVSTLFLVGTTLKRFLDASVRKIVFLGVKTTLSSGWILDPGKGSIEGCTTGSRPSVRNYPSRERVGVVRVLFAGTVTPDLCDGVGMKGRDCYRHGRGNRNTLRVE